MQENLRYIEKQMLVAFFDGIIEVLLKHKPDDPVRFLRKHYEEINESKLKAGYRRKSAHGGKIGASTHLMGAINGGTTSRKRSVQLGLLADYDEEETDLSCDGSVVFQNEEKTFSKAAVECDAKQAAAEEIDLCMEEGNTECLLFELKLPTVPPELFRLEALTSLDLSRNQLVTLPDDFIALPLLEDLNLRCNLLVEVPPSISCIPYLTVLNLDENSLSSIPDCYGEMVSLRTITMDWNEFTEFPSVLCCIVDLEELKLIENPLASTLPISRLEEMTHLELAVDNSPALVEGWGDGLPNVTMEWNKIFPDNIIPGLYLGSLRSAQSPRVYQELGITHVASIGRELKVVLLDGMQHTQANIDDLASVDITVIFADIHAFIDKAMSQKTNILVHCFKGQSRSATIVASYLIRKNGWTEARALKFVKTRSPRINPNPGFCKILVDYAEKFLVKGKQHSIEADGDKTRDVLGSN